MKARGLVSIILAVGFIGFCFWPIAATNLSIGKQTDAMIRAAENRPMTPKPRLNVFDMRYSMVKRLPGELEDYFVDTFPFRLNMVGAVVFMQNGRAPSFNGRGFFGQDGWMYLNDSYGGGNSIDDFLGLYRLDARQFDEHFAKLDKKRRLYEEHGIIFYFMIAPNKVSIHPEHLPKLLLQSKSQTVREQYMALYRKRIAQEGIRDFIIDPTEALRVEADITNLYYPMDTHWNWQGRFVAGNQLLNRVRRDFPKLGKIPELATEPKPAWADLPQILGSKVTAKERGTSSFPKLDQWNFIDQKTYGVPTITAQTKIRHYYNPDNTLDIFFMGDSFMDGYQPLPEAFVFRNAYYTSASYHDGIIMQKIFDKAVEMRPDIVVEEMVERNLLLYAEPPGV